VFFQEVVVCSLSILDRTRARMNVSPTGVGKTYRLGPTLNQTKPDVGRSSFDLDDRVSPQVDTFLTLFHKAIQYGVTCPKHYYRLASTTWQTAVSTYQSYDGSMTSDASHAGSMWMV